GERGRQIGEDHPPGFEGRVERPLRGLPGGAGGQAGSALREIDRPGAVLALLGRGHRREGVELEPEPREIGVPPGLILLPGELELLEEAPRLTPPLGQPTRPPAAQLLDVKLAEPHPCLTPSSSGGRARRKKPPTAEWLFVGASRLILPSGAGSGD